MVSHYYDWYSDVNATYKSETSDYHNSEVTFYNVSLLNQPARHCTYSARSVGMSEILVGCLAE